MNIAAPEQPWLHASVRAVLLCLMLCLAACGGGGGGGGGGAAAAPGGGSTGGGGGAGGGGGGAGGTLPTWEWILQSPPATPPTVGFYDFDGFEATSAYVTAAEARGDKTICYISVGTAEDFRPDYAQFQAIAGALGNAFPGFANERYLNIHNYTAFISIMDARLKMCHDKGFDYVEFDNMDTYSESASTTGFSISQADEIAYVTDLVHRTNGYGMQAVQKNADDLTTQLQPLFGAVLFEECNRLHFCAAAAPYVSAGKPALNAEYPESWPGGTLNQATICSQSAAAGVSTIIARIDLDGPTTHCV